MFGGHPLPDTTPLVLSPTDSEGDDQVQDLFDDANCDSLAAQYQPKQSTLHTFNQIAATLHLPVSPKYSRSSCPNLTGMTLTCTLLNTTENDNEDLLKTPHGTITVSREGNPRGPPIITIHDIGLNHTSNFQSFFNCSAMRPILAKFCIYHITAPGQQAGAVEIPADSHYPSMVELSEMVECVCQNYSISHCVGLGVGMGANVLVRLASRRPRMVDGLILINCNSQTSGWLEWAHHKVNMKALKKANRLPDSVVEYLVWYHMGSIPKDKGRGHVSPVVMFRQYFQNEVKPSNLAAIMQSYVRRSDLKIQRERSTGKSKSEGQATLEMPVLNIVGDRSPHVEATVTLNGRLNPAKCTWMKIQNAGMVLEEQQEKVAEAVGLFLQGLGHTLRIGRSRSAVNNTQNRLSLQLKGYETPLVKMKVQHQGGSMKI